MNRGDVDRWLTSYVAAWRSYDRDEIAALFSADAVCRYHPYDDPIVGRDAIVASWLGEGDYEGAGWSADPEGTYDAEYRAVAVDGDTAVATGTSRYFTEPGGELRDVFHNIFVLRFDEAGRCRESTEWYMRSPDPRPPDPADEHSPEP